MRETTLFHEILGGQWEFLPDVVNTDSIGNELSEVLVGRHDVNHFLWFLVVNVVGNEVVSLGYFVHLPPDEQLVQTLTDDIAFPGKIFLDQLLSIGEWLRFFLRVKVFLHAFHTGIESLHVIGQVFFLFGLGVILVTVGLVLVVYLVTEQAALLVVKEHVNVVERPLEHHRL